MKKLPLFLALSANCLCYADFTFNVHFGAIYNTSLADSVGVDKIGVIVVSTQGASFPQGDVLAGKSLTSGSNWGSGVFVINTMSSVAVSVDQDGNTATPADLTHSFAGTLPTVVTSGFGGEFTLGDKLAVYWFPSITDTNSASGTANVTPSRIIASGDNYGFYRTDVVQMGTFVVANTAFEVTSLTGSGIRLQARSPNSLTPAQETSVGTAPLPANTDFVANLTVGAVPEPSTYALMGLGLVVVGLVARRKKA